MLKTRLAFTACCSLPLLAQQVPDFPGMLAEFPAEQEDYEIVADIDLDGDYDLVSCQTLGGGADKVSFRVRLLDRGIWVRGPSTALATGTGATITCSDLDGDGLPELVFDSTATHALGSGLQIHRNLGGGQFAPPMHVALTGDVQDVHAGDANGDGLGDLLVRHDDGGLLRATWLLGGPGAVMTSAATTTLPASPFAAIVDADLDGNDDLAYVHAGGGTLDILRTQAGSFAPFASFTVPAQPPRGLIAVDWTSDGRLDLLATFAQGSDDLWIPLNNDTPWSVGLPSLTPSIQGAAYYPEDIDDDGWTDIWVRDRQPLGQTVDHSLVLRINSQGQFVGLDRVMLRVPVDSPSTGAGLADVNGDGMLDFIDSKAIRVGNGRATPSNPIHFSPGGYDLLDWDGDGDLDWGREARNNGRAEVISAPGDWPRAPTGLRYNVVDGFGDIGGDSLHEWMVHVFATATWFPTFVETRLFRETPAGDVVDAGAATAPGVWLDDGVFDDADDDGDTDYIDRAGVWANDGSDFFTHLAGSPDGYRPTAVGDLDGNGMSDLLVVHTNGAAQTGAAVRLRNGPASYTTTVLFTSVPASTADPAAILADLDDDGDLDVAAVREWPANVLRTLVFENVGGTFTLAATLDMHGRIFAGDVNGDDRTDLAAYDRQSDYLWIHHRSSGGLSYEQPLRFFTSDVYTSLNDVDLDGDVDLCGYQTWWNTRIVGDDGGYRRQYGEGAAGTGERRPLLSITGHCRPGQSIDLRLRHALGGSFAFLLAGSTENDAPSPFLPGVQSYVGGIDVILTFDLTGTYPEAGRGGFDVPVAIPPGAANLQMFLQCLVLDPAATGGFTYSNGCELWVGL